MEKVEKFIHEHTKKCYNVCSYNSLECEIPWLTPDDARKVAEIAKEETIKEVCEWLSNHYRDYMHNPTGKQLEAFFGMDMINDLKKHFNNKLEVNI